MWLIIMIMRISSLELRPTDIEQNILSVLNHMWW